MADDHVTTLSVQLGSHTERKERRRRRRTRASTMVAFVVSLILLSSLAVFHFHRSHLHGARPSPYSYTSASGHLSTPVQSHHSAAESVWMSFVRSTSGQSRLGNIIITTSIPLLKQQKGIFRYVLVRHFTFLNSPLAMWGRGCVAVQSLDPMIVLPRSE